MKKTMILLLTIIMLVGLLAACGDKKKSDNSGGSTTPSQIETQNLEASIEHGLPEGAIIEYEKTIEIDENNNDSENKIEREDKFD